MLIDLSRLNRVTVDVAARTATAEPAIKNTELVAALAQHELAFPAGHCPTVAIGGYLLAGDQGWNQGGWGIACSNVLAIDLVNAEGVLITADAPAQHGPAVGCARWRPRLPRGDPPLSSATIPDAEDDYAMRIRVSIRANRGGGAVASPNGTFPAKLHRAAPVASSAASWRS